MSTIEPSGPWVTAMERARATDPRNGRPSWNRLAELAGVGTSTVTAMVKGSKQTSAGTIAKVAAALGEDPQTISEWLGLARPVRRAYEAPEEADLLTDRQRKALTELIRAFVAPEEGEHGGDTTPTSEPADELDHRRRALKADQIAADEVPNAARTDL